MARPTEWKNLQKCRLLALTVFTLILLPVLLSVVGYWRALRIERMEDKQQELCFNIESFVKAEDGQRCPDGLRMDSNKIKNAIQCCGKAGLVLDGLVSRALSDRYDSNMNPEMTYVNLTEFNCKEVSKPQVTKLVGLNKTKQPVLVGETSKVFWNPQNASHTHTSLKYLTDDGTLYVDKSGLYFISSKINIRFKNISDTHQLQTFKHYVYLISNKKGTITILLEDARSMCDTVTYPTEVTSFLGALFKLEKGDRMYVATSHPQYLSYEDSNSFFSIHEM